jgi:hypothetical protein
MSLARGTDGRPTLDSLVLEYRRETAAYRGEPRANIELEIRLQAVDCATCARVVAQLGAGKKVAQIVSALAKAAGTKGEAAPRVSTIREIHFVAGLRSREEVLRKSPIAHAWVSPSGAYKVALALELQEGDTPSFDESSVIRVKHRTSAVIDVAGPSGPLPWRVDVSIVRQLAGTDASAVKHAVDRLFRTPGVDADPFAALNLLADAPSADAERAMYQYEVEIEFVGAPDVRDSVRSADVVAAADAVLTLAKPSFLADAALRADVQFAAEFLPHHAGGAPLSLKRLLPQVGALSRADYATMYPCWGFYVTDKADGVRALGVARQGRGSVAADVHYSFGASDSTLVTILDGELVGAGTPAAAFYAFDAIVVAGATLVDRPFEERLAHLEAGVLALCAHGVPARAKPYRLIAMPASLAASTALAAANTAPTASTATNASTATSAPAAPNSATSAPAATSATSAPAATSATSAPAATTAPAARPKRGQKGGADALEREEQEIAAAVRAAIEPAAKGKRPYEIDGLIFVRPGHPYVSTQSYKWKPAEHNTIDFLAMRAPARVQGKVPFVHRAGFVLHFLFAGAKASIVTALGLERCPGYQDLFPDAGSDGDYVPIPFAPSDAPLAYLYWHPAASDPIDGAVVEMRCGGGCEAAGGGASLVGWQLVRERVDRRRDLASNHYFGNDHRTAELVWLNYIDPFPLEDLWRRPAGGYFATGKSSVYQAQTAVLSYVKTCRIATLRHAAWVVDIGAGKGQDLGRYLDAGVQNLVAVDQDRPALVELVRRKYEFAAQNNSRHKAGYQPHGERRAKSSSVYVLAADVDADPKGTIERVHALGLPPDGADALVCNLAFHYFISSATRLRSFAALAAKLVRAGGTLVLTVLLGDRVHAALKNVPYGQTWDVFESPAEGVPPARKYSIRRDYRSDALEVAGQKIGVLLPFSRGEYYEEFLVNPAAVVEAFTDRGFKLSWSTPVDLSFPNFAVRNPSVYEALSPGDCSWLALYGELIFTRVA